MRRKVLVSSLVLLICSAVACSYPSFEENGETVTVSFQGTEWVLAPSEEEFEIEGVVRSFYRKGSGPYAAFCGTMTLQWEMSEEEFYEEFGDPSPIMNELDDVVGGSCQEDFMTMMRMRDETMVPLSADKEIHRALSAVKPGDEVYLEGNKASVESVDCKEKNVKRLSNIVLVTYAEINGKTYGD